jgi:hypothetical protein
MPDPDDDVTTELDETEPIERANREERLREEHRRRVLDATAAATTDARLAEAAEALRLADAARAESDRLHHVADTELLHQRRVEANLDGQRARLLDAEADEAAATASQRRRQAAAEQPPPSASRPEQTPVARRYEVPRKPKKKKEELGFDLSD